MKTNARAHVLLAVAAALGMAGAPTAAQAYEFTPEGSANWVGIARSLTLAIDSGYEQTRVCKGINAFAATHASVVKEITSIKGWAWQAHYQTCFGLGFDANHNGAKCKGYKKAIGELSKAMPGTDPADVIAAAAMFKESLISMVAELQDAKLC